MKHTRVMLKGVTEARRKECVLSGRKMSGGMVESPAEKNKSRSFRDAGSLGWINKERINSQEQSLRQPEREIKKGRRNEKFFSIIHPRCIKVGLQWYTVFIADFGFFCIISAPTETPAWLWKSQATSLIATCYARASTKAKKNDNKAGLRPFL